MSEHSTDELGKALGCVVYDMLMLFAALSVYRKRGDYPHYEGLTWGEPQIAIEVILIKCRSLMDFLSPHGQSERDILITDFDHPAIAISQSMNSFRRSVNQWSAHLSWQRARQSLSGAVQPVQADMATHARWLLSKADEFVQECINEGIEFVEERHKRFWRAFAREYGKFLATES